MTQSNQPTVRLNAAAKQKLDLIQKQTALSQPALMDRAINLLEHELLAERLEADFKSLGDDEQQLAVYKRIGQAFDKSTHDGIGNP